MHDWDGREEWENHIVDRCNDVLLRLKDENQEYRDSVHRRIQLSEAVKPFMDAKSSIEMTAELQDALREYIESMLEGQSMDEMIVCYKCGFGDALNIAIETGVLPHQR